MPDPTAATATQLRNIEAAMGLTMAELAAAVASHGIDGHARTVRVPQGRVRPLARERERRRAEGPRLLAVGGPATADTLLDAQYAGPKAALRPEIERLRTVALDLVPSFSDVEVVVQNTGVAFRRRRQFGVAQAASAKRIQLGINLDATPDDPRVQATPGAMCSHRIDLPDLDSVDADVTRWLTEAYERAG